MLGRNQFLLNDEDDDEKNLITAFLKQYYNDAVDIPKEILIPEKIAEIELLQEWLWAEKKKKTKILLPKRGVKKDILMMAKENAEKYLLEQEQKLKDKLPDMSEEEQLRLLATNGMLVKRPLIVEENLVLTGFKEKEWTEKLL